MTPFEFGDSALVPFPFADQSTTKERPAVVISSKTYNTERPDFIIMAVTSQVKPTSIIGGDCAGLAGSRPAQALGHQAGDHHHREAPGH
jgi:hypothetical protein